MRAVQVATAGFDVAPATGVLPQRDTRATARAPLRPGWPLALLFYGFPLWWALGLAHFIFFIVAVPMAIELMRRSPVRAPRWFGLWLVFLAWVLLGLITLWTHAPGTTYSAGLGRLIGFGLNYLWYISATIVLLYVYNLRERELSTVRVQRMVAFMFIVTALFGLAGTLAPSFEFKSLMEYVMPGGISHADFIHAMIHPQLASASDLLGYEQPRPIAPFMYANAWGNNLAMSAPMFVAAWFGAKAKWRAMVGVGILLVAAIPIIHSLNRGMWLGLALALVFAVIRFAIAGHTKPLNLLIVALVVGTIGFVASPLYATVTERFAHPHSNERRGNLAGESVTTALTSPVIGYGGTRAKQGSYASIAAADSARCGSCGAPSLGTQGYLWLLLLGSGYVGAALCLMFLLSQFLSAVRRVDPTSMIASVSILMSLLFFFIYDSLGSALFLLMIAIATNARMADQPVAPTGRRSRGKAQPRRGKDLSEYVGFVRRNALVIVMLPLLGAVIGGVIAMTSPTSYAARSAVLLPRAPVYVDTVGDHSPPAVTIDTDAQLFSSPKVSRQVSKATGVPEDEVQSRLLISAEPLTRVLTVTFQASTPEIARAGSEAAAHEMLKVRSDVILAGNLRRMGAIRFSLARLQTDAIRLERHGKGSDPFARDLADRIQVLQGVSSQLQVLSASPGQVMDNAHVVRTEKARAPTKWAGSGAGIGLLCALALSYFRPRGGWLRRTRGRRSIPRVWDVPPRAAR